MLSFLVQEGAMYAAGGELPSVILLSYGPHVQ